MDFVTPITVLAYAKKYFAISGTDIKAFSNIANLT
jgi:hypothetical protein